MRTLPPDAAHDGPRLENEGTFPPMNRRLLIADDEPYLLEYYKNFFGSPGFRSVEKDGSCPLPFEVETFLNGPDLISHFRQEHSAGRRVPLCMLDVRMLPIDGIETAERLREIDPDVVIIIVTAYDDLDIMEICRRLKNDIYYVKKPFEAEELFALIHSLLRGWNDRQELRRQRLRLKAALLQLERARGTAERANTAKSEFLAGMSHEIRTPISAIIGMTDLLMLAELLPDQRRHVDIIRKSSESLLVLINDILDLSKIEAGKLALETIDFDLRTLLEDISDLMAVKSSQKGILYTCKIGHAVPSLLHGDPIRLRQILLNLIDNAIKFTARGEVRFAVELLRDTGDTAALGFSVVDTGIGIPEDRIDRLFDRYSQADMATSRRYGGSGLGLYISRQLCDMMGGRMSVESQPGMGTTFRLNLILEKHQSSLSCSWHGAEPINGKRVLVLDAHAANREVLTEHLRFWECIPDQAATCREALRCLAAADHAGAPFDLVIVDSRPTDMPVDEFLKRLKDTALLTPPPLIIMSPLGNREAESGGSGAAASACLGKPVKQSSLLKALYTALSRTDAVCCVPANGYGEAQRPSWRTQEPVIRILMAEDNPALQEVGIGLLRELGYGTDLVPDGAAAVAALKRRSYDLVFMDIEMPEMNGYEATRLIRSGEDGIVRPDVPIIALTAHGMKAKLDLCFETGMNDYLTKPVRLTELDRVLRRYLQMSVDTGMYTHTPSTPNRPSALNPRVFDMAETVSRLGGSRQLIKTLMRTFTENTPRQIAEIRDAIQREDARKLHITGHALKGASATAGAFLMRDIATQLETAGRTGDFQAALDLIPMMEREFDQFKQVLSQTDLL